MNQNKYSQTKHLSFKVTYEDLPNNYDAIVNTALNKLSYEMIEEGSPEVLETLLDLHEKYPTIPAIMEKLAAFYHSQHDMKKTEEYLEKLTRSCPDYFLGYYVRAMKALNENNPEAVPVIFNNCFNIQDFFSNRNSFHINEVAGFSYIMTLYYCAINNIKAAQNNYNLIATLICKKDKKLQELQDNIKKTKTLNKIMSDYKKINIDEILPALKNDALPINAILTALGHSEEVTPILLNFLDDIVNNYQTTDDVTEYADIITTLFILAKLQEQKAFPYIIKIASLPGDWPELILDNVLMDNLASLLISTYNDDLSAIKNLIENPHIDLWSRNAGLECLHALFALEKITRQEIIDYYAYLLKTPIIQDKQFLPWLIDAINVMYPIELYNEIMPLMDDPSFDHMVITQENIDDTLALGLAECLSQYIYSKNNLKPIDTIFNHVAWLYDPVEEDDEIEDENKCEDCDACEDENIMFRRSSAKIGRNESCPCDSGKKYKKCCLTVEN